MKFKNLFVRKTVKSNSIIVVSGLPRSGTSMMMQILEAGGIKPITDNERLADIDNTKGYYEHQAVKALAKGNADCLKNAEGCSIKVISTLLHYLPNDRAYKVIFMQRNMNEVLASQKKMLTNLASEANQNNDHRLKRLYMSDLVKTRSWLFQQKHIDVLYLDYADVIERPKGQINIINHFLGLKLKTKRALSIVDQTMRHHNIINEPLTNSQDT